MIGPIRMELELRLPASGPVVGPATLDRDLVMSRRDAQRELSIPISRCEGGNPGERRIPHGHLPYHWTPAKLAALSHVAGLANWRRDHRPNHECGPDTNQRSKA